MGKRQRWFSKVGFGLENVKTHSLGTVKRRRWFSLVGFRNELVNGFMGLLRLDRTPDPSLQELVEEIGIYFVLYDRAGYGESDPNLQCSLKSEASDIQELADEL